MKMVGHGETPRPEQTEAFIERVDEFIKVIKKDYKRDMAYFVN